jgi:hypothetical protein
MRVIVLAAVSCGLGLMQPAYAEEFAWPARKPGQWELRMKAGNDAPEMSVKLCLDAETDKDMMQLGTGIAKSMCPDQKITREPGKVVIDGTCDAGGIKVSGRTEIVGDLQSDYTMVMRSDIADAPEGMPKENNMEHRGRWISATCGDGMVPGDMVLPGGIKMNMKSMKGLMDNFGGVLGQP